MQEKVYLGVKNHATGDYYVVACTLPAQFGRKNDKSNQILLHPDYGTISRYHGMIERTSRGFVYTDSSASGSRVGGLVVRDSRVSLAPNFFIEIENYTISRVDATPFIIISTHAPARDSAQNPEAQLREVQQLELLEGRGIGLARAEGGKARGQPGASRPSIELVDLNRWDEQDKARLGHFELSEGQPVLVIEGDPERVKVQINKSPVTRARTPLKPLDVVELSGMRFEVLHPNERRIVCGYHGCSLLNPPPFEANCRWCGRHLANTGGFSRIV